jgi:hypothetical protein
MKEKRPEGTDHGIIKILSWHLPGRSGEKHKNTSDRIANVPAKVRTKHLPNMSL